MPRPMPRLDPVTSATFPSNPSSMPSILLTRGNGGGAPRPYRICRSEKGQAGGQELGQPCWPIGFARRCKGWAKGRSLLPTSKPGSAKRLGRGAPPPHCARNRKPERHVRCRPSVRERRMSSRKRRDGASQSFELVAGNGLLDRRALLGRGIALAGAMGTGGAAITGAAAEPLQNDPWSLEMGSGGPAHQVTARLEKA